MPALTFRARRAEILRRFLLRLAIYSTASLHERLEARARINLDRALDGLA